MASSAMRGVLIRFEFTNGNRRSAFQTIDNLKDQHRRLLLGLRVVVKNLQRIAWLNVIRSSPSRIKRGIISFYASFQ